MEVKKEDAITLGESLEVSVLVVVRSKRLLIVLVESLVIEDTAST
jgi:hypothetical protein